MNLVDANGNELEPRIGVSVAGSDATLRDTRTEKPRHRDSRVALGVGDGLVPPSAATPRQYHKPTYTKDENGGEWINLDGKWISREEFERLNYGDKVEKISVHRSHPLSLVLPGETEAVGVSKAEDRAILDARGEEVSSLTWKGFLAWRKTKCRPFYREALIESAANPTNSLGEEDERLLEEIDQATHEFVGEVAELGQLFLENGPTAFFGEKRDKLIDECGDILFCGVWALDAWGVNPLYGADDLELLRVSDDSDLAVFARAIIVNGEAVLADRRFVSMMGGLVMNLMLQGQTNAGLTSNAFKKLRFQRREQNIEAQVARILAVLIMANQLLIVANSSVEEALKVNQRKLDARYPNGYQPGQGGGIRTGEGK